MDQACQELCGGSWARFLEHFCKCSVNKWCPTWVKHNYEVRNAGAKVERPETERSCAR